MSLRSCGRVAKKLLTVCGFAAVRAIAQHTPERIERLFFDAEHAPLFAEACRYLAGKRRTYRLVSHDELQKITDTPHHQGAAAVIHEPAALHASELHLSSGTLCLHDVLNPHNVGAIARTAAFFGITHLMLSEKTFSAAMTASAWRVAEGGMTHCRLYTYPAPRVLFSEAEKKGWFTAAALRPGRAKPMTLGDLLQKKDSSPLIICLGNEETGLPTEFVKGCRARFTIPGSGMVESLNVSVAAALCVAKLSGL